MTTVFTRILPFLIAAAALAQQSPLDFPGGHGPRPREAGGLIAGNQAFLFSMMKPRSERRLSVDQISEDLSQGTAPGF